MARHHIPNLAAIRSLTNEEVKFYAIIGASVSITAGLELALYDVFEKATGLKRQIAAKIFYGTQNTGARRDIADAAMREFLAGKAKEVEEWIVLAGRIVAATGQSSDRHLIAHNAVNMRTTTWLTPIGGAPHGFGEAFGPLGQIHIYPSKIDFAVVQDEIQVFAGARKADQADFDSLSKFCTDVITLIDDLDRFLVRV